MARHPGERGADHADVEVLDSGHVPFVEIPDVFLETVLPFLVAARSSDPISPVASAS